MNISRKENKNGNAPAPVVERGLAEIGVAMMTRSDSTIPRWARWRLRVVVRQSVPVLRHRQHPHGAERGNHRDIHDNPHGPIPQFTQWENCVSLPVVPGGSGNPAGVAFRQRKRAFVLSDEPILLAKGIVM